MNELPKEILENAFKEVEALKEEANRYKEIQVNSIKQVKHMNKASQDLKREIEAIKKTQTEAILEMENLGKRIGTTGTNITNRIQEMDERISGVEESISQKKAKPKKFMTQNMKGS